MTKRPRAVDVLSKEAAYRGYARIDRYRLRHEMFAGGMGPEIRRELYERGHAVAVLPYDPCRNAVVLIEQFRIGAYAAGDEPWLIEIVAGIIEDGETPEDVARREAEEEAGCAISDLVAGPSFYASPGISTEHVRTFVGRTDVQGVGGIHGLAAEGEDIRVAVHSLDDALAMLNAGRILFAPAAVALQWLALNRDDVLARWR